MPAAKEDTWAFQPIGAPFPEKPVKCCGQQNMYVARLYKEDKYIIGIIWNNEGVVECSFPYNKAELKTKDQLGGQIQVLTYKGDHNDLGFWYNWIKYSDRFDNSEKARETVRCGDSYPILWHDRPEGALLGFVDNKTEIALFSCDGKVYQKSGGELNNMIMIVRELKGGPPNCFCFTRELDELDLKKPANYFCFNDNTLRQWRLFPIEFNLGSKKTSVTLMGIDWLMKDISPLKIYEITGDVDYDKNRYNPFKWYFGKIVLSKQEELNLYALKKLKNCSFSDYDAPEGFMNEIYSNVNFCSINFYSEIVPAKEDLWAFLPIGNSFPEKPVKCLGQQNMYVALWYKDGKPIHGRSWNNGGVVECSFPYNKAEMKTKDQLGGQIQVLTYKGDHNDLGFWYNWIKYSDRFDNSEKARETVRCGDSFPILWPDCPEGALLGFVDNKTEIALFSCDGKVYQKSGGELNNMMMIVREMKGGPPNCICAGCGAGPVIRVTLNHWADFRAGDPWPTEQKVQALGKTLDTIAGQNPDQFVALWYQAGEPVMGRIWNEDEKIAANFGWGGNEYKSKIGSIQVLFHLWDHVRDFDYEWKPFQEAAVFGEKEWHPVHVNHHKGDISPGVITINGKQILGKVDVRNERATVAFDGKEQVLVGPAVHPVMVLCRKAKPGCKLD